jgi:DNA-3-methyladenine glycosylase
MRNRQRVRVEFFKRQVDEVARALIGASLVFRAASGIASGVIVEAEAYEQGDPASHTEYKNSKMNKSMYLSAGHLYVYPKSTFCHLNLVCGGACYGSAVLIRALEPSEGSKPLMRRRREKQTRTALDDKSLCDGPIKLCQALDIGPELDGKSLEEVPLELYEPEEPPEVWCGPRIGVAKDPEYIAEHIVPARRYALARSPFISHRNATKYPLTAWHPGSGASACAIEAPPRRSQEPPKL